MIGIVVTLLLVVVYETRLLIVTRPMAQLTHVGIHVGSMGPGRVGTKTASSTTPAMGRVDGREHPTASAADQCYRRIQMGALPGEMVAPYPFMNHTVDVRVLHNMREVRLQSKAQSFQDVWIAEHVDDETLRTGTFLEFGARDGVEHSNTFTLEKVLGWRGILIEASPKCR